MSAKLVSTPDKRIRLLMDKQGLKQSDLSRLTGIDKSSISLYLKGKYKPKGDKVHSIAKALNADPAYIMGFDCEATPSNTLPSPRITADVVSFPIVGSIAAGYEHIADENWTGDTVDIPISYLKGRNKEDYFVLSVDGDSMYPLYQNDDKVLILKQSTLNRSGDIGAVLYDDEKATLKKVEYVPGEDWIKLIPINPTYQPQIIEGEALEHCRIIGVPKLLIREIE